MSKHIDAKHEQCIDSKLEQLIESMGAVTVHFNGSSMMPMLRDRRDLVVVEKICRPLQLHDVPVYRMPSGKIIMHRIIKIKNGEYIIRGDNLVQKEYGITDDMIIGALKGFYRDKKYIDCNKSVGYKWYVFIWTHTFALRYIWMGLLHPLASKIKHKLLK